jgi:endonuclease I
MYPQLRLWAAITYILLYHPVPALWEEDRNYRIELEQGNRNPFIDHPELGE